MAAIFYASTKCTRNVIPFVICVYNDFFALEFLNLRFDNTHLFFSKKMVVATMLEGYFIVM